MPRETRYSEKLKDPRWQKKRLEILERDNWMCRCCGATDETLHVHHLDYKPGEEPWVCPAEWLVTLCESCHDDERERRPEFDRRVLTALSRAGWGYEDLDMLAWVIENRPEIMDVAWAAAGDRRRRGITRSP